MPRQDGRIEPGQKLSSAISARAWNRAQQAADIVLGATTGLEASPGALVSAPYTWVYAKNDSGATVPRWGVMAITGVEITPTADMAERATRQFEQMPVLTLDDTTNAGERCVAIEPISHGKVGRVAIAGCVQVKKADLPKVTNCTVLWEDANWALVRFGGSNIRICKTTYEWSKNTIAMLEVWEAGEPENPEANDPAETLEAANLFNDIPADVFVAVAKAANGTWYAVEWQDATCDSEAEEPIPRVAGHDLTALAGYDRTKTQLLGHEGGCLVWIDTTICDTPPT